MNDVDAVLAERAKTHGDALVVFEMVALMWSAFLSRKLTQPITRAEVCLMLSQHKQVRHQNGEPNPDDLLDNEGYSKLARQMYSHTKETETHA